MCVRDVEFGNPRVAGALVLVWRITAGVAFLVLEEEVGAAGPFELRRLPVAYLDMGFGVVLESPVGSFVLLAGGFIGVFRTGLADPEA
jgi:hypothetical protein